MRLILLLFLLSATCASAEGTVAFFGLHLTDSTRQTTLRDTLTPSDPDAEDMARLGRLEDMVSQRFQAEGYALLDLAPVAQDLDRVTNPAQCYGCDVRMAKKLGADFILVGEIHKVSNALLALNLQLRDGQSGEILRGGSVDIRGNTEEMWQRGMLYILKNRMFREENK